MSRNLTIKTIASLVFTMAASAAFAHAQLQKATPAVGSTVAGSPRKSGSISEGVEPRFSGIALTTDAGAADHSESQASIPPTTRP